MDYSLVKILSEFGALGVLAVFAGTLLRFFMKQQDKLASLLNNHLTSLLERQEKTNQVLDRMLEILLEDKAHFQRHEDYMDKRLDKLEKE